MIKLARPAIVALLLTGPLMAQSQVTVTSSNDPGTYVPLSKNTSALNPREIASATTLGEMQMAILDQSAIIHNATVHGLPSVFGAATQIFTQPAASAGGPMTSAVTPAASSYTPPPFNSLANSAAFVQHQISSSVGGLPQTYYVPSGATTGNQVIDNGVGLYDTSLSLIALIQSGNLSQAQKIIDIYNGGTYGPPPSTATIPPAAEVLSAYPTGNNGGAFAPFNSSAYYYFDFADTNAKYEPSWNQYGSHTGPNAWLALAICQYIQAERKAGVSDTVLAPYLTMVSRIANAMILLQDNQTQGAVRYGPHASYEDPYNTVNSENNVDAYSAFNMIAQVMQQSTSATYSSMSSTYVKASGKILNWLQNASVYNPITGQTQHGMLDASTGLLYTGLTYSATNNRWEVQTTSDSQGRLVPQEAEDSGGSWTISALGPKTIDSLWGKGTALAMWQGIRNTFGRTETQSGNPSTIRPAGPNDPLVGVDYSNFYSADQSLISPEWTGGAIDAVKQLLAYYKTYTSPVVHGHPPLNGVPPSELASLSADLQSMQSFLAQGQDAYAIGPGITGSRQGNTGFSWQAPLDTSTSAMASIYGTLQDPLAAWRSQSTSTRPTTPTVSSN